MGGFVGRAERINQRIKIHDYKLYCDENGEGKLCIYRKSNRIEYYLDHEVDFGFVRPAPHFIMALTNNWQMNGEPVDWGIEPIMARLKAMDLWNRNLAEDLLKDYEKHEESKQREFSNNTESFLKEFRSTFKKVFSDVNTSNMEKIDKRRIKEKSHVSR